MTPLYVFIYLSIEGRIALISIQLRVLIFICLLPIATGKQVPETAIPIFAPQWQTVMPSQLVSELEGRTEITLSTGPYSD